MKKLNNNWLVMSLCLFFFSLVLEAVFTKAMTLLDDLLRLAGLTNL
ncbi:hypothetical protein ACQCN2_12065 [Brevibacillus ginsengisoli]